MTIDFSAEDALPVDLLAATETIFRDTAGDLFLARRKLRQGDAAQALEAAKAVKDLKLAFELVMQERVRIEKLRKEIAGVVHDYAIDFDAARHEIGRRLACLRDAGGGGRISGDT